MTLRTLALVSAIAGIPLSLAILVLPLTWGYGGYLEVIGARSTAFSYVDPNGPAAKAGLRQGERAIPPSGAEAIAEDSGSVGTVAHLAVLGRDGQRRTISFPFVPFSGSLAVREQLDRVLSALTALGAFVVGLLVVLRAREQRAGERAALVLLLAGLHAFCQGAALVCGNAWLATLLYWVVPKFLAGAIIWASLRFLAIFPPNATRIRTFLGNAAIVALLWGIAVSFGWTYDMWRGAGTFAVIEVGIKPVDLLLTAAVIVAIIDGMVTARSAHAAAMRWLGSMWLLATLLSVAVPSIAVGGHSQDLWNAVVVFFLAFGVAYPVLRHRLVDLNILVSRATVFGVASAIIVGLFVIAEWIIGRVFEQSMGFSAQHQGLAAQALALVVVLVLGISARSIHGFVEERMTKTFFRKRMRGLAEIKRVARETDAATDARAIMELTVTTAQRCLDPLGTALYVSANDGYECVGSSGSFEFPRRVGFNDEPALRLRRWHEPFELDDDSEAGHHVLFVPMTLRGELLGFLCCGPKPDRTSYLKDEVDALALLAHQVGIAVAWLEPVAGFRPAVAPA